MRAEAKRISRQARRRQTGFTLVEIMIVVLILSLLLNIAAPAFVHARDTGQARACVTNLHNITLAKEEYGMENNVPASTTPTWSDLTSYVRAGTTPLCPTNGAPYNYGNLNTLPTCSYGGPIGLPHTQ